MSNASNISELEKAEHLNYADGKGVKRVSIYNNGVQSNVATEETQLAVKNAVENISISSGGGIPANKATDAYGYQAKSTTATHTYYFYEDGAANWYIMRKTIATGVFDYAKGTGGYGSVYVDATTAPSGTPTFDSYEAIFDNVGAGSLEFETDGQLKTALYGKTGTDTFQVPRLNPQTHALNVINYEHHEIHSGSHYFYADKVELNSAGAQDYLLTTADTTAWSHLTFTATGSAVTQIDFYEATNKSGTSAQTTVNNDRNSSNTSGMTIHKGTSGGSTDGTLIYTLKSGASAGSSRTPSTASRDNEIILKQNTKYILRVTSGTNNNLTNVQLEWYEHVNKTA